MFFKQARLKSTIANPSSEELVHHVFKPLDMVSERYTFYICGDRCGQNHKNMSFAEPFSFTCIYYVNAAALALVRLYLISYYKGRSLP